MGLFQIRLLFTIYSLNRSMPNLKEGVANVQKIVDTYHLLFPSDSVNKNKLLYYLRGMEKEGWMTSKWVQQVPDANFQTKKYRLTERGKKILDEVQISSLPIPERHFQATTDEKMLINLAHNIHEILQQMVKEIVEDPQRFHERIQAQKLIITNTQKILKRV